MQNVAQAWLVYRLTDSSLMLGVVAFCSLFPVLLFSLFGGVLADRLNRWRLLLTAHTLGMLQALTLAVLALGGWIAPWHIIVLALGLGVIHALEMPSRHSFIAEMVPRHDLSNAIALNSGAFNTARFLGPSLAGWLVAWHGEGIVFLINALSFLAILLALLAMQLTHRARPVRPGSALSQIGEGLRFAWQQRHVRAGLLLIGVMSIAAAAVTVLMPVFAREVFGGDSAILGILLGSMGVGAVLGALKLAHRTDHQGIDRMIGVAGVVAGVGVLLFATVHHVMFALIVLAVVGFCQTTLVASTNALIQLLAPDELRGRVMSLFSMIFIGMMPFGSLLAGGLAHYIHAPITVALFGGLGLTASIWFLIRVPVLESLDEVQMQRPEPAVPSNRDGEIKAPE